MEDERERAPRLEKRVGWAGMGEGAGWRGGDGCG